MADPFPVSDPVPIADLLLPVKTHSLHSVSLDPFIYHITIYLVSRDLTPQDGQKLLRGKVTFLASSVEHAPKPVTPPPL